MSTSFGCGRPSRRGGVNSDGPGRAVDPRGRWCDDVCVLRVERRQHPSRRPTRGGVRARKWRVALFVSSALIMDKYYVTGTKVTFSFFFFALGIVL